MKMTSQHASASFLLGSCATMGACVFSNPLEVVKTRMQLQGELKTRGGYVKAYSNPAQAFASIFREEGLRGVQRGLGSNLAYQCIMNGIRLGGYGHIKAFYDEAVFHGRYVFVCGLLSGASSGIIGASIGQPFYLAKTRLQAYSTGKIAVGTQHGHTSTLSCFRDILRQDGVPGLFRGTSGAVSRVAAGSAIQLSTYDECKRFFIQKVGLKSDALTTHFVSSLMASFYVVMGMNPFDVITTRLCNQPVVNGKGQLYNGFVDCFAKIVKTEGFGGLYKGTVAHYFRLGPHTIMTFVFWEQLKMLYAKHVV